MLVAFTANAVSLHDIETRPGTANEHAVITVAGNRIARARPAADEIRLRAVTKFNPGPVIRKGCRAIGSDANQIPGDEIVSRAWIKNGNALISVSRNDISRAGEETSNGIRLRAII